MKQSIGCQKQCYLTAKSSVLSLFLAIPMLIGIGFPSVPVTADQIAVQPQQNLPTTSDFTQPIQKETASAGFGTSDSFLAETGGIQKATKEDSEVAPEVNAHDGTYDKEKCEEIANGWTCTSFYIGGAKQKEMLHQTYSEGDSQKGSSWSTDETHVWDKDGNLIKNENIRVQSEWQYDDEKHYKYTQRYKNGILEDENFSQAVLPSDGNRQGLLIEYGKL